MTAEKRKSRVGHSGACLQSQGWEMEAGVLEVRLSPRPVLTGHESHLPKPVPQVLPQREHCQCE